MLIGADVLGRLIQPGQEVPVGAMTALIGGPWLLYLAWKTAKTHSRGDRQMGGTLKPMRLTSCCNGCCYAPDCYHVDGFII